MSVPARRTRIYTALLFAAFFVSRMQAQSVSVEIKNPSNIERSNEVVELPLAEIAEHLHVAPEVPLAAHLHGSIKNIPTQIYSTEPEGKPDRLLVLVDLAPSGKLRLDINVVSKSPEFKTRVQGRLVPERMDDFAWENDLVAFRVYGPALQVTGEITSGVDVWSKRVPDFITTSWYERDRESARTHNPALSYHKDNGQGLDSYEVGNSRGCGGTAVWIDGSLHPSKNFVSSKILAQGPIRLDFLLDYESWDAGGISVREKKRITLDAGSRLNRMRSTFHFDGVLANKSSVTVAAGVAMHKDAVLHQPNRGILSVWDTPQLASAGRIGTALLVPSAKSVRFSNQTAHGKDAGSALFLFDIKDGETIDYYAGSAWSQGGTPTQEDFDSILKAAQIRLDDPVSYRWIGAGERSR